MVAANPTLRLSYRDSGSMVLSGRAIRVLDYRQPLTTEDVRVHTWINERLAILDRNRRGLWAKVRRFFFC